MRVRDPLMATTPRDRLANEKDRIRDLPEQGYCSSETTDALLEFGEALDSEKVRHKYRDGSGNVKTLQPRSIDRYLSCLRICVKDGLDLLDTTAEEFNALMDTMHDDEGKAKTTVQGYQAAGEAFFRYHSQIGVDPEDINHYGTRSEPRHDEHDMFTPEDIEALRQAVGETKTPVRNRALLELLIFTGQRIGALVTLRIGDVQFNEGNHGYIYLNEEYDKANGGLKGALNRGKKRPMFGATKYVRDWIQYHPKGGDDPDPDAWLFIGDPSHWKTDPDDHWAKVSADQTLRRIGEYADVDKPVNPHNFRHYCATVLYRDYDIDRDTIRMLLGHVRGSSALEEVYSHLFEDDYIQKAEEQMGYREKEDRNPFTPETCPTCGELLDDDAKACPGCGAVFTPDAQSAQEQLKDQKKESYREAGRAGDMDAFDDIEDVDELLENPAVKEALIKKLQED